MLYTQTSVLMSRHVYSALPCTSLFLASVLVSFLFIILFWSLLLCSISFFFFFSCYGDHRDLHSFPTRRSSDLLQSGLLFQLFELSDEDKLAALQLRARQRGFDLPVAVGEFILLRAERELSALMQILEELDRSSLQQQRKLTIPLVKSTLGW